MKTQQQITAYCWSIADALRGSLPSDVVAETPAFLFFLKRFTDLASAGRLQDWPVRGANQLKVTYAGFSWAKFAKEGEAGPALVAQLEQIENSIPDLNGLSTKHLFAQAVAVRSDLDAALLKVFSLMSELDTGNLTHEEAATVFQNLLDAMAERAASSVTPTSVRDLLVRLAGPTSRDSLYDPVCGYASLLCQANRIGGKPSARRKISGQELNASTLLMAKMNMLLHGMSADLHWGDTLLAPANGHKDTYRLDRFDVVLANPPFGMKLEAGLNAKDDFGRFNPVEPSSSELAFVLHVLASLSPTGRAVVLVPNGILFRSGNDETVRRHLVETGRIAAVVALPAHLFPGTPIQVSVLVLRGTEIARTEKSCLFVDLTTHAEGPTTKRHLSSRGIDQTAACMRTPADHPGFSKIATQTEIAEQEFNLSVGRYVQSTSTDTPLKLGPELIAFHQAIQRRNVAEAEALRLLEIVNTQRRTPNA